MSRALLNKSIEAKLSSSLRADTTVQATTPIAEPGGCLEKLRAIFLEKNPLWLRRHYYFKCLQQKGETVNEWWVRKTDKARECNLEAITADDIRLLELIRGVHSFKLRQEFLRTKDPTLKGLLQIARNWQVATEVEKGMETSSVDARKTSSYKKEKSAKWEDKAKSKEEQSQSKEACGNCGRSNHPRSECPAKDKECNKCGKKGHFGAVCRSKSTNEGGGRDRGRSQSRGRSGTSRAQSPVEAGVRSGRVSMSRGGRSRSRSTHLPEIRCGRVAARHATDDSEPTPLMEDVKIKPVIGTPFRFDVFPDTGCYQSIISLDLVRTYGLNIDRGRVKKIKAVNGARMECSGSVSFTVIYEGHETDVLALVTPALQNEILLSWRTLQRLGVIPDDFPHCSRPKMSTEIHSKAVIEESKKNELNETH